MSEPNLSSEQVATLLSGVCPWCNSRWRSVAHHIARKHGISARQLREMAGLPWSAPLADPEVRERAAEVARAGAKVEAMRGRPRDTSSVSAAGAARRAQNLHRRQPRKLPADAGPAIQARLDRGERLRDVAVTYGCTVSAVSLFMKAERNA